MNYGMWSPPALALVYFHCPPYFFYETDGWKDKCITICFLKGIVLNSVIYSPPCCSKYTDFLKHKPNSETWTNYTGCSILCNYIAWELRLSVFWKAHKSTIKVSCAIIVSPLKLHNNLCVKKLKFKLQHKQIWSSSPLNVQENSWEN